MRVKQRIQRRLSFWEGMNIRGETMNASPRHRWSSSPDLRKSGKIGWILMWLLGVPIPVLIVLFLIRGCT
ncbi:MAG TPA: hypothetical protein DCZ95_19000 [Verrucomicrobia bacterium]|nr:hypothetical protein [Verrucomicrobiota bacterium]